MEGRVTSVQVLETRADVANLREVVGFVDRVLEEAGASQVSRMRLGLAVEEVFVNIARYAYAPGTGWVRVECGADGMTAIITFTDRGREFDPLSRAEPDVGVPVGERPGGGLGIFLVRRIADRVAYSRRDGCNVLTIEKDVAAPGRIRARGVSSGRGTRRSRTCRGRPSRRPRR